MLQRITKLLVMLWCVGLLMGCANPGGDAAALDHDVDGVRISFRTADWGVRDFWTQGPSVYRAEPVPPEERPLILLAAKDALRRVPPLLPLLRESNFRVVFVNRLELDQVRVGGFCGNQGICLAVRGRSDLRLEHGLYHEAAHLLMHRCGARFPHEAWSKLNPDGFEYISDNAIEAIKSREVKLVLRTELARAGFVSRYAQTNLEEDFAETSAILLRLPELTRVWEETDRTRELYPALMAKLKLAQAIWEAELPGMTDFFRTGTARPQIPSDTAPDLDRNSGPKPVLIALSKYEYRP